MACVHVDFRLVFSFGFSFVAFIFFCDTWLLLVGIAFYEFRTKVPFSQYRSTTIRFYTSYTAAAAVWHPNGMAIVDFVVAVVCLFIFCFCLRYGPWAVSNTIVMVSHRQQCVGRCVCVCDRTSELHNTACSRH